MHVSTIPKLCERGSRMRYGLKNYGNRPRTAPEDARGRSETASASLQVTQLLIFGVHLKRAIWGVNSGR